MNFEWKKKWIEALTSGKYEQGKFSLRYNDKFCCLGVLCDIIDPDKWVLLSDDTVKVYNYKDGDFVSGSYLGYSISGKTDVSRTIQQILSSMNDDEKSFQEIALYIEEYL